MISSYVLIQYGSMIESAPHFDDQFPHGPDVFPLEGLVSSRAACGVWAPRRPRFLGAAMSRWSASGSAAQQRIFGEELGWKWHGVHPDTPRCLGKTGEDVCFTMFHPANLGNTYFFGQGYWVIVSSGHAKTFGRHSHQRSRGNHTQMGAIFTNFCVETLWFIWGNKRQQWWMVTVLRVKNRRPTFRVFSFLAAHAQDFRSSCPMPKSCWGRWWIVSRTSWCWDWEAPWCASRDMGKGDKLMS